MIDQSDNVIKLNSINRRMFILAAAKVIILGGIVSRLFFLQVKENKKYLTLSDKNRIREWKLPPIRGDFKDFFGKLFIDIAIFFFFKISSSQTLNLNEFSIEISLELFENFIFFIFSKFLCSHK